MCAGGPEGWKSSWVLQQRGQVQWISQGPKGSVSCSALQITSHEAGQHHAASSSEGRLLPFAVTGALPSVTSLPSPNATPRYMEHAPVSGL